MKIFFIFLVGILSSLSSAQDGSLDTSFGNGGIVVTDLENSQDLGFSVVQQADQKLIVTGTTTTNSSNYYPYLIRYMTDGTVDTTFGVNGKIFTDYGAGFNAYKYLFVDNQQKIIGAGIIGNNSNFIVAKYLENGDLDNDFAINGVLTITNGNYAGMALLDDGSFLLLKFSGNNEITINHYLSNGQLDAGFGTNGAAVSSFSGSGFTGREIKIDGENNIYFLGTRDNAANSDIILMRFLPDGYLDNSFGNNGMTSKNIDALNPMNFSSASLDFTNDNKIVIAGSCGACVDLFNPIYQPYFIRYTNDGTPDTNFGTNGTILLPVSDFIIGQLLIQENQRMVVSGYYPDCFEGSLYGVKRYISNGTIDNSFNGPALEFENYKTILQDDGKIVSVGNTFWYNGLEDIFLLRLNNDPLSLPEFKGNKFTIYPNPSNGIFTIERSFFSKKDGFQVTDTTGKIIALGELTNKQSQINLSSAQSGMYFLKTSNSIFRLLKN